MAGGRVGILMTTLISCHVALWTLVERSFCLADVALVHHLFRRKQKNLPPFLLPRVSRVESLPPCSFMRRRNNFIDRSTQHPHVLLIDLISSILLLSSIPRYYCIGDSRFMHSQPHQLELQTEGIPLWAY